MSYEHPTYEELAKDTLLRMMSDFSQDYWCAGWLSGLEFTLWDAMRNGPMDSEWEQLEERDLNRMKSLHELAGGWWIWDDNEIGNRFVTTDEWLKIYSQEKETGSAQNP
jgi:hypothetical protein